MAPIFGARLGQVRRVKIIRSKFIVACYTIDEPEMWAAPHIPLAVWNQGWGNAEFNKLSRILGAICPRSKIQLVQQMEPVLYIPGTACPNGKISLPVKQLPAAVVSSFVKAVACSPAFCENTVSIK